MAHGESVSSGGMRMQRSANKRYLSWQRNAYGGGAQQ